MNRHCTHPTVWLFLFVAAVQFLPGQSAMVETSGWIEFHEPAMKLSLRFPPDWKKSSAKDGSSLSFTPDQPMMDNNGRPIRPMIGVANAESPEAVQSYLKNIDSGLFEKRSTTTFDYYVGTIEWKNIQRMYVYVEVAKGKRYIGCTLMPHSNDPASMKFERTFLAIVQSLKFETSTNTAPPKKNVEEPALRSRWKVD